MVAGHLREVPVPAGGARGQLEGERLAALPGLDHRPAQPHRPRAGAVPTAPAPVSLQLQSRFSIYGMAAVGHASPRELQL